MLQSRLENEQFKSLPTLAATDRSRTGFISTDRPDSSHVCFCLANVNMNAACYVVSCLIVS
jgi:hypothetical protein